MTQVFYRQIVAMDQLSEAFGRVVTPEHGRRQPLRAECQSPAWQCRAEIASDNRVPSGTPILFTSPNAYC